jgi:hypothetical protein
MVVWHEIVQANWDSILAYHSELGSGLDPHFVLVNFGARLGYIGGSLPISFECSKFCHNARWKHIPFKIDTCTILLMYVMNILRFLFICSLYDIL